MLHYVYYACFDHAALCCITRTMLALIPRIMLHSAADKLSFAARTMPAGRTFLRRLYDFSKATSGKGNNSVLRIPESAQEDIHWWIDALRYWKGKSFFLMDTFTPSPDLVLQTDASGTIGYGAYFNGRWLHGRWTEVQQPLSIEYKELFAIVTACCTWGSKWTRMRICFQCDSKSVVDCIKSGTSKSPEIMSLIRSLYHICSEHDFLVSSAHIPGITNVIADSISEASGLLQRFKELAPMAAPVPDTPVLPHHH